MVTSNPFSAGQSVGGGAYKGISYDSKTGQLILRSGDGGSKTLTQSQSPADLERQRQQEEARKVELARQQAIEKQKADAEKRRKQFEQEKAYAESLRRMNAQQRRQFLIEQAKIQNAIRLQELQDKGKVLTQQSKDFIKQTGQKLKNQAILDYLKPKTFQEIVQEARMTGVSVKPTDTKLNITKKIEKKILGEGTKREQLYRRFEEIAFNRAKTLEKTQISKNFRTFADDVNMVAPIILRDIPIALTNLAISVGKGTFNLSKDIVKNPKKYTNELKNVQNKFISYINKNYNKFNSPKKLLSQFAKFYYNQKLSNQRMSQLRKKAIIKGIESTIVTSFNVTSFVNNYKLKNIPRDTKRLIIGADNTIRRTAQITYQNLFMLPPALLQIVNNPKLIKDVPKGILDYQVETIKLLKTNPSEGIARIGADYFTFKIIGGSLKVTGKITGKIARRINPKWKNFKSGIINIKTPKQTFIRRGKEVYLNKRIGKYDLGYLTSKFSRQFLEQSKIVPRGLLKRIKIRRPGQFRKFQKGKGITLKKGVIGEGVPLSQQVKLAGTRGTITTAQADRLVNFLRRTKIIRKPIPNESNFSVGLKNLLKRFDEGKLSPKEIIKLNELVLKESGKTLLERTLFADPSGVIRFTRLGKDVAEASIRDILRGDFTFKKAKPQVIVFPEGQIARFPKYLKDIINKLKANKRLTPQERAKLVRWQVKPSNKWKPIGDVEYRGGVELEVTLAPGQTIRRVRKLAITEINGVPVEIIEAKVIKLSNKASSLLNKAKKGTILNKEIEFLRKLLSKETNLPVRTRDIINLRKNIRRRVTTGRKYYPVGRKLTTRAIRSLGRNGRRIGGRFVSRFNGRVQTPRPPRTVGGGKRISTRQLRSGVKKPQIRKPPVRPPRITPPRPPIRPPKKIISRLQKEYSIRKLSKSQPTYYIKVKKRGKIVNLNQKPLTLRDAKDLLAYHIDNNLVRTGFFEPLRKSKQVIGLPPRIKGYFGKVSRKLRPYRIRAGKRKELRMGYIEKRKYFSDTSGERRQLKTLRKKISPQRRKQLILQLKRARQVRLRNLRKRR